MKPFPKNPPPFHFFGLRVLNKIMPASFILATLLIVSTSSQAVNIVWLSFIFLATNLFLIYIEDFDNPKRQSKIDFLRILLTCIFPAILFWTSFSFNRKISICFYSPLDYCDFSIHFIYTTKASGPIHIPFHPYCIHYRNNLIPSSHP